MVPTPGTYLRMRREADGESIESVAAMISTEPKLDEAGRIEWLRQIEAGVLPVGADVIEALQHAFPFDPIVLNDLADFHRGDLLDPPQLCRRCGCSDHDPCDPPCWWKPQAENLCSSCPDDEPGEDALPVNDEGDNAAEPDHTQGMAA